MTSPQNLNKPHSKTGRIGKGRLHMRPSFTASEHPTDLHSVSGHRRDELDRLRAKPHLFQLLVHYADLGALSRETWQDRLMAMEGVESPEMSKLHGDLIAFNWIEQNTGNFSVIRAGEVPACYRVTLNGLRAIEQIKAPEVDEREMAEPVVKKVRGKSREGKLVGAAG
jgi:hypothetical protein